MKHRKSKRTIENEALTEMIEDIFYEHKARYGSRRIQKVLEQQGIYVNAKKSMQTYGSALVNLKNKFEKLLTLCPLFLEMTIRIPYCIKKVALS